MDPEKAWHRALKNTEIVRTRIQALFTLSDTRVPYILLSESCINIGDTVVRQGEVLVEKPSLIIPPNNPQFYGFDFNPGSGINEDAVVNFLLIRGVALPSLKYDNKTQSLNMYEGSLSSAIEHYRELLQQQENVHTGLIVGPEDCWQFSLLIFICSQVAKNVDGDIRKLIEKFRKRNGLD